jgi:hypothetical protein
MAGIIITILALGLGGMAIIMVHKWVKDDNEMKKLKLQKEMSEAEIEQMDKKIKLLEEENKKYDRIITEEEKMIPEKEYDELKILRLQKEDAELEMKKMKNKIELLEIENKKYSELRKE